VDRRLSRADKLHARAHVDDAHSSARDELHARAHARAHDRAHDELHARARDELHARAYYYHAYAGAGHGTADGHIGRRVNRSANTMHPPVASDCALAQPAWQPKLSLRVRAVCTDGPGVACRER
jgi:hypothetical protein